MKWQKKLNKKCYTCKNNIAAINTEEHYVLCNIGNPHWVMCTYYMERAPKVNADAQHPASTGEPRHFNVFKCSECGYEARLEEKDMKDLKGVLCGNFHCSTDYCVEVRREIEDADGNITAVIL